MKNRKEYIDIAKGIAIVLVIIGHCLDSQNKVCEILKNLIYTFHMPLFFILSGYFYKKNSVKDTIKNGFKKLLFPYIYTTIIILLLKVGLGWIKGLYIGDIIKQYAIAALYGSGEISTILSYDVKIVGAIWFLLSLFWTKSLYCVIDNNLNGIKKYCTILFISIVGFILPKFVWLPLSIETALVSILFYEIGAIMKKKNMFEKKVSNYILIPIFVVFIISGFFIKTYCVSNYYNLYYINIIVGAVNTYFIVIISKRLENTKFIKNILCWCGKNSLYIMCFHCIEGRGAIPLDSIIRLNNLIIKISKRLGFALMTTWLFEKVNFERKMKNEKI